MRAALALVALAGCGVPALKLDFHIDNDPASDQSCYANTCEDIPITCGAVESIRIFDPAQPSAPYLSQCQVIPPGPKKNLCTIVQNTLDTSKELPVSTLAVEVVVYPEAMIPKDASGNLQCPTEANGLEFDATGMPTGHITMQDPIDPTVVRNFAPAIGGRSYWHPGDDDVTVTLGCNDKGKLADKSCDGSQNANTTAQVYDLDINQAVSPAIAQGLLVGIGNPTHVSGGTDVQNELLPTNTTQLELQLSPLAWTGNVTPAFTMPYCLEVIDEQDSPITPTLTCKDVDPTSSEIKMIGYRITSSTIDELLRGRYGMVPPVGDGIVIGVVYQDSVGAKGHVVSTSTPNMLPSTIHYLDPRTCVTVGTSQVCQFKDSGATATTESGYFIADSMDNVPFGTIFKTMGAKGENVQALGGNVKGKITIVVLQFSTLPNQ